MPASISSETVESPIETASQKLLQARQRLPLNLLSNISWLVVNMFVGLWYTPYLIANLGVAVYGLVPLTISVTNYLHLLTDGFDSAVSRFLQIELARDNTKGAIRIFNTSIAGALIIFVLIIPVAFALAWLTPRIFHVPGGHEGDAQWLVLLTILAFGITFLSSSFAVSSFASHRFDLRLGLNILRLSAQMGSVILLFNLLSPHLWQVGIGIILSALFYLVGHYGLSRKLTPQLKMRLGLFDSLQLKQMVRFSGWVLVNQAGAQLFLNIDLIVANLVFGTFVAGRYGAVIIFSSLLRSMVATISAVFDPIVFTLYAQNKASTLARFSSLSVKFMGLVIAFPIGLICGLAKPILSLWLGPEYSDLSWLVVVLVGHLCINLAIVPLFSIQVSTNNVRLPGILTLVMGISNAGLAVTLALWGGLGYLGIAVAGAIVLTAKNAIFTPIYNARILQLPWWIFLPNLAKTALATMLVAAASYWMSLIMPSITWLQLVMVTTLVGGGYVVAAYNIGLDTSERSLIKTELQQRLIK